MHLCGGFTRSSPALEKTLYRTYVLSKNTFSYLQLILLYSNVFFISPNLRAHSRTLVLLWFVSRKVRSKLKEFFSNVSSFTSANFCSIEFSGRVHARDKRDVRPWDVKIKLGIAAVERDGKYSAWQNLNAIISSSSFHRADLCLSVMEVSSHSPAIRESYHPCLLCLPSVRDFIEGRESSCKVPPFYRPAVIDIPVCDRYL